MSTSRVFSVAEFLRAYPLRAGNMMWLLGAGAYWGQTVFYQVFFFGRPRGFRCNVLPASSSRYA